MRPVAFAERGILFSLESGAIRTLVRECYFVNGTLVVPSLMTPDVTAESFQRMNAGCAQLSQSGDYTYYDPESSQDTFLPGL